MRYPTLLLLFASICLVSHQTWAQTPGTAIRYFKSGEQKMQKGELLAAVEDYTKAIQISSRPISAKRQHTQTTSSNQFDNSSEITILDPFTAYAYTSRAAGYIELREFDMAISDCEKALRIKPGLAAAYLARGTARRARGD